jgi:hypothetical protein
MVANNPNKVNPPIIAAKTMPAAAARLFKNIDLIKCRLKNCFDLKLIP